MEVGLPAMTSNGNDQTACEETTIPVKATPNGEITLDKVDHVVCSQGQEDDTDQNNFKNRTHRSLSNETDNEGVMISSVSEPPQECQQILPSDEMENSVVDVSAATPDGLLSDTIAEKGEMKPEGLDEQGETFSQIDPVSSNVTENAEEITVKKLTVTLNTEEKVEDGDTFLIQTESNDESLLNVDKAACPNDIGHDFASGNSKETASNMEKNEVSSKKNSTSESDRLLSAKQRSDLFTPSKTGTPETGISSTTRSELGTPSKSITPPPPSQELQDRPQTQASGTSESLDSKDFKTPDYDFSLTPLYSVGGDSVINRQDRKTISRGDSSTKSVTFADDFISRRSTKDHGMEEGNESENAVEIHHQKREDSASWVKDEVGSEGKIEPKENNEKSTEAASTGLFPTAVSEEKIEEAKLKQKERAAGPTDVTSGKEHRAFRRLGELQPGDRQTMDEVIGTKAREQGCVLVSELKHSQAIICFDKAINLCPREVRYYVMRGETYLQLCDFQSAILNLKKVCVLDPDNDSYYKRLAFVYYFQGQTLFDQCLFAEALESFSRASEMRPEVVGYHTRSVACLAALQRHGECLALINKRIEVEQDNPDLYIMRARLHELFRNTSLCYYDLKDAIALDPGRAEASALMRQLEAKADEIRDLAIRLQLQGKLKEAMHKITEAVETNPAVAEYHLLRGALHRRLHDYNAAIDDFLLALDKTEHNEQSRVYTEAQRQLLLTYNDFAVECFLGGHFEEAIILLNKAIKGEKREKGLYVNRGDCFFRLNELHFALADYHQALELDNADSAIHSRIASIHNEFGLMDYEEHGYHEAEARFTLAIQHNPRVGAYYVSRAKARYVLENHGGARHDLLVTLHLQPNNEEILPLLARLFPGKPISDIMRSKAARQAKAEVDNAVVTASPIYLPALTGDHAVEEEQLSVMPQAKAQATGTAKHVAFKASVTTPPDLKACMDEISFNTAVAKQKKKISNGVQTLLHGRQNLWTDLPKLCPQPPARPYAVRGGGLNKKQSDIDVAAGWRTFSVGVGLR